MSGKKQNVISEDVALTELEAFFTKWQKKPISRDKIKDEYPETFDAICSGHLVIDDEKVPTYTLRTPVTNESGGIEKDVIVFKTRVKPTTKGDLADGLDLKKQTLKFALRMIAHVAGLPAVAWLDKFSSEDYELISELAGVFTSGGK